MSRREFCNGDGEQQKKNTIRLAKNIFAHASHFFVQFLAVVAGLRHETS